ncbi:hypothetical protein DQP55_10285 [Mycolicibacterium sp. GF69]|nr:hypothetical protein DQP55_10285 [Mycolicibacterium sp. GF69]
MLTRVKEHGGVASGRGICHNVGVADNKGKKRYVDPGWPAGDGEDDHPISELAADRTGALSPFGELTFPLPAEDLPYLHPVTVVNK